MPQNHGLSGLEPAQTPFYSELQDRAGPPLPCMLGTLCPRHARWACRTRMHARRAPAAVRATGSPRAAGSTRARSGTQRASPSPHRWTGVPPRAAGRLCLRAAQARKHGASF
eukprot:51133-Chlamydomonas_euryale.AAC.4